MKRFRRAMLLVALLALVLEGCASSRPPRMKEGSMSGLASWYGQEYAGRLTANGEIFDPSKLTAAHRTLPFGTIVKVTNPKNGKSVNVRINDRGPFIAGRIIDLSYGAAAAIGLVADGVAPVQLSIVRLGGGASEAPKPLVVEIPPSGARPKAPVAAPPPAATAPSRPTPAPAAVTTPAPPATSSNPKAASSPASSSPAAAAIEGEAASSPPPPPVPFPLPKTAEPSPPPPSAATPATPETTPAAPAPPVRERVRPVPARTPRATTEANGRSWSLQLGAFGSEENARKLRDRAKAITPHVNVVKIGGLYRVRVGPFTSEVSAIEMRERFDAAGFKTYLISK